ncbi:MAG: T9SS type A sorting domain-containing protein, partial [Saprospiraceae bacterium]
YMEVEAGRIIFAFFIYINGHVIGMVVPYSVPIDGVVCIAIEKAVGGQITFYINELSYTKDSWVLRDDVAYLPRVYNTNAWILSPTKSEGLHTSCANLLQTDATLLFQATLLGLSDALARQIKNSTLETRTALLSPSATLAVFPNPTSNFLNISVTSTIFENSAKLIVTNAVGQQVLTKQWTSLPESISLEVVALPVGTYFVQLIADAQLFTTKFMKQ